MDIQEKVNNWLRNEDSVKVVQEFEEIIRNKKSDIIWLAYHQGQIFRKKKKEKEQLVCMVLKSNVSKMTIVFKIAFSKLIDNYPKIKKLFTILKSA